MIDNAPLVLVSMDKEGRYTRLEGQRLRQVKVAAAELLGRSAFEVGTGLGLVSTRHLVEAQGSVGVQSEPGRGSTFVAKLPRG